MTNGSFLPQRSKHHALLLWKYIINLPERKFKNFSLDINNKMNALSRDVHDTREIKRQMFVSQQNELSSNSEFAAEKGK